MTTSNKVIHGLKRAFLEQTGVQLVSFVVFLLLARILGPQSFGLIALSQAFVLFTTQIVQQGFSQAIIQRKELEETHLNAAFWANIFFSLISLLILICFAETIARLFQEPKLEEIIYVLSIIFLITPILTVQQAVFKRNLDFKPLAKQSLIGTSIGNAVAV